MEDKKSMKILHMMSGGRDSLLSAAIQIEKEPDVMYTLSCDNGCIHGIEVAAEQVTLLQSIYKDTIIKPLMIANTGFTFNGYMQEFNYESAVSLIENYGLIKPYMMNCMNCRLAMYTHAIAIANVLDIKIISDGTRADGGFITDTMEFLNELTSFCDILYGIKVEFPVYDLTDNFERKKLLDQRGLPTKTKEAQCYIGMKPKELHSAEISQYRNWFIENGKSMMVRDIKELEKFYSSSI